MLRFLIFLIPILVNYSMGGMFFITAHRLAEAGASPMAVTATAACWAVFYAGASLLAGRIVTARNAYRLILLSFVGMFLAGLGFLIFSDVYVQFLWIAVCGVSMALYCTPFQVYMKGFEKKAAEGVVASTCKYTGSWSLGMGIGAFLIGLLGWRLGYMLIAAVAALMFGILIVLESCRSRLQAGAVSYAPENGVTEQPAPRSMPDCVVPAWFLGGCGTFVIFIVRTLEPVLAVQQDISSAHAGAILSLVSFTQVAVAWLLIRRTRWYYDWRAVLFLGLAGAVGLVLFAVGKSCALLYAAALVYGVHSGMFYLFFVYHALVHPVNSGRYVSVNEAIVGGTTIFGCLAGGLIAQMFSNRTVFVLGAVFVLVSAFLAAMSIRRRVSGGVN